MGRKISNAARVAISLSVAPALLLATTACGEGETEAGEDKVSYCVDKDGKVIDDAQCEQYEQQHASSGGGSGMNEALFYYMLLSNSGPHYYPGQMIPSSVSSQPGYARVPANNPAAREAAGLPRTGKISSGTKISGIGRGSTAGRGGSSGGGAKGGSGSSGS